MPLLNVLPGVCAVDSRKFILLWLWLWLWLLSALVFCIFFIIPHVRVARIYTQYYCCSTISQQKRVRISTSRCNDVRANIGKTGRFRPWKIIIQYSLNGPKFVPRKHGSETLANQHHQVQKLRKMARRSRFVTCAMAQFSGRSGLRDIVSNLSAQAT